MLANKISGTHVGLWLLLPEHLHLGTWDLIKGWCGVSGNGELVPRLALQVLHEAALCVPGGMRKRNTLRQKDFEALNGLPFVATDVSIHNLFDHHSVREANRLQITLAKIRKALGHYNGKLILIDPHRILSWTKREMPLRKTERNSKARKTLQTFFIVDGDSGQPILAHTGSPALTATQATISLVEDLKLILSNRGLILADAEHFTNDLIHFLFNDTDFDFLIPAPRYEKIMKTIKAMTYKPICAGYAVAEGRYRMTGNENSIRLLGQRLGEIDCEHKPFVTSSDKDSKSLMTSIFPKRWPIEEFFLIEQGLGWKKSSTHNINIRHGKLTMGLIAQAALHQLRKKLPDGLRNMTAEKMAQKIFSGIDGDIRVKDDTILVTLYNAPNEEYFKEQYTKLPQKLELKGIDPRVPWLFDFKVDFKFK